MMPRKNKHQDPSIVHNAIKSLIQEIRDWRHLIRTEWPMLALMIGGIVLLLFASDPFPPRNVYLAVGQEGSSFEQLGNKFKPYFEAEGITLHLVNTTGYTESMQAISGPDSTLNAAFSLAGIAHKGLYPNLQTLGSIEYVPLWFFHRGNDLDTSAVIAAFKNEKISIGPVGSGTDILSHRLISLTDLDIRDKPNFLYLSNADATQKIIDGEIFGMFIADAENGPSLKKLLEQKNLRLFNFEYAQAIAKKIPILNPVILPKGALDLRLRHPATDINMLATTATLIIKKDTHPAIQQIFLSAAEYISRDLDPLFSNPEFFPVYLDRNFPLSPIASRYYEKGAPDLEGRLPLWLVSYLDKIWLLLVGAFAIIYPLFKLFPNYRHARAGLLVSNAYEDLLQIEREAQETSEIPTLRQLLARIQEINVQTLDISIPSDEMNRLYSFRGSLNTVRQLITNKIKENEK
jgi:TRAP-type uncharacterized transport system substrate-binding protein